MNRVKLTYRLLRSAIENEHKKQLAVFLQYKNIYENSCIYDWNYSKVSRITGDSRRKVKRLVDFFLEEGWCREHSGNLIFNSVEHLTSLYDEKYRDKALKFHIEGGTQKELVDAINASALFFKIGQCKNEYLRLFSKGKRDADKIPEKKLREIFSSNQMFSYKGLYRILGQHPYYIIKRLEKLGFLHVQRNPVEVVGKWKSKDSFIDSNCFIHKGLLLRQISSIYSIIMDGFIKTLPMHLELSRLPY